MLSTAQQRERDEFWMRKALEQARLAADAGEVPVGVVIVKDEQLLVASCNKPIGANDPTAHAEMVAIRAAGDLLQNYRLTGCTLYVTLEPCTMCYGAMVHARIDRLVYGAKEAKAGVIESQLQLPEQSFYNHFFEVEGGVLAEACSQTLSDFFALRREQKKRAKLAAKESRET